ncbi:hypothetical protein OF83DRAFT_1058699 [Amylostereum chailletii]|nr:hypothetical protein OF83DRAFT_1058699 [Amylostereum chailletii]
MLYRTLAPLSLALLALLPSVSAHGALMKVVIDGKSYIGNGPGGDPKTTAIRPTKAYDNGPVKGATNPDLVCGLESKNAALIADANPGSTVQVLWADGNITVSARVSSIAAARLTSSVVDP